MDSRSLYGERAAFEARPYPGHMCRFVFKDQRRKRDGARMKYWRARLLVNINNIVVHFCEMYENPLSNTLTKILG